MSDSFLSFAPALGLLLILVALAWGAQWLKKRITPTGSGQGARLRLVSQLALGPQQRVVVVEVVGPQGPVQLTLGVTPQQVSTLHTQALDTPPVKTGNATTTAAAVPEPSYQAVVQALRSPPTGSTP